MRTAIDVSPRTFSFQAGGVADVPPEYRLPPGVTTPVTPPQQVSPVQPPPGAAGPTPAAVPPERQLPTQAITPTPVQKPFDDNEGFDEGNRAEAEAFDGKHVRSHRGDNQFIQGEAPEPISIDDHAEAQKLRDLIEIYPTITNPKNQKEAKNDILKMQQRLQRETDRTNDKAHKEFMSKEKMELAKADTKSYGVLQIPNIDQLIQTGYDKLNTALQARKEGTVEQRHEAEILEQATPAVTFAQDPDKLLLITKNIMALNPELNLSPEAAARLTSALVTPPRRGQQGLNSFRGRAAANYAPWGTDVLNNRILRTQYGNIRVSKDAYGMIKNGRITGYNNMIKKAADLEQQRKDETTSGIIPWISRQLDPLFNPAPAR